MTQKNHQLHYVEWIPADPVAILFLVHGYAEYGGRYTDFAKRLKERKIGVIACDLPGHGNSPGKRAYLESWDNLISHLDNWLQGVRARYSHIPHFIFGHSMGGLAVADYVTTYNLHFHGVILSSSALKVKEDLSPILQKLSPIIAAILPSVKTVKLNPNFTSRSAEAVERYKNDPQIYTGGVYAKTGSELLKATERFEKKFSAFQHPVLVLHGDADQLTEPKGSVRFYEECASTDKTLKIYPGAYHELLNDFDRAQVMEDIGEWIQARI